MHGIANAGKPAPRPSLLQFLLQRQVAAADAFPIDIVEIDTIGHLNGKERPNGPVNILLVIAGGSLLCLSSNGQVPMDTVVFANNHNE